MNRSSIVAELHRATAQALRRKTHGERSREYHEARRALDNAYADYCEAVESDFEVAEPRFVNSQNWLGRAA